MKITDGKKTVELKIMKWNGNGYDPDWSMDYFEAGSLPYNEETDCYTVEDVDYCIEMAKSADEEGACWKLNEEGEIVRDENMIVTVEDVTGEVKSPETLTIAEIRASTGLSQAAFAKRFRIPLRSVENWEGGQRTPPVYVKLLLAQVCGLTDIFKDEG